MANLPSSVTTILRGLGTSEKKKIRAVIRFGERHLHDIRRRSGESYAVHGCEVAAALRELTDDASLLSVAVLHDLLVHPEGESLLRLSPLSAKERSLVRHLYPLRRLHIDDSTEDLDKVVTAFSNDGRILPLRIAHRLNDVRHLQRFSFTLGRQISRETLHMYAAIAGRLGMQVWRHEMENICFLFLQPRIAEKLQQRFTAVAELDKTCLTHAERYLKRALRRESVPGQIQPRIKGLYSTYCKMLIKRRTFEQLTDRLALRLIVSSVPDCYRALGVVHASFHPIPGKLKDYIGAPKENGYQSIHTVVYPLVNVSEQPLEIQIRTEHMHRHCEFGPASHGDYKDCLYAMDSKMSRVGLLRGLQTLREESRSPQQFSHALRHFFRQDHIVTFDEHDHLYYLRKPITALDFVCHAHGRRCTCLKAVRINGRPRPLHTILHDGDTVEAVYSRKRTIEKSWISFCHSRASRDLLKQLLISSSTARSTALQ